jgi:hypothetical protein
MKLNITGVEKLLKGSIFQSIAVWEDRYRFNLSSNDKTFVLEVYRDESPTNSYAYTANLISIHSVLDVHIFPFHIDIKQFSSISRFTDWVESCLATYDKGLLSGSTKPFDSVIPLPNDKMTLFYK